jgi:M6 family metalloprotease-like protein
MSTQFRNQLFTFTQPDGSTLQLRGSGNQDYAVFETLDGRTVVQNPATGFYEIATLSEDGARLMPAGPLGSAGTAAARSLRVSRAGAAAAAREAKLRKAGRRCEQRRQERRAQEQTIRAIGAAGGPLLAPPKRQTVGDYTGLCLLIDFSDEPATIAQADVEQFCNQPGYTGFGNNGSVYDFFLQSSLGRCRYKNVVTPYYRAKQPKTYYTNPNVPYGQRAVELIGEALAYHKSKGFNFAPLTPDNQGFVYATNVFYAGGVTNNWGKGLWPHAHFLPSAVALVQGRAAHDYQVTAIGAQLELGTFCHENGHMLCDYPDLYDEGDQSSGIGHYCLMCGGNNASETNPVEISAYLKRLSGWSDNVIPIEHGRTITLQAGSNECAIYSRSGREYFLIEYRRKAGRDTALPDEGLAIWHVDETGDNEREAMTAASHYELSLEQADGLFQLERLRGHNGNANDLYAGPGARFADNTTPSSKWWNGTSSNLIIDQVTPAGGASISFRCLLSDIGAPPPAVVKRTSSPAKPIPDNNATGVSDTIAIAETFTLASIKVGVDIVHPYRGDLRVTLLTPWGTLVELHPKGQGSNADNLKIIYDETNLPALSTLRGKSAQGSWQLTVQDLANADLGTFASWSLELTAAAEVAGPIELKETPGAAILDYPKPALERSLTTASTMKVGSVEVSVDISHSWIGDVRLSLVSPAGTEVVLRDVNEDDGDVLTATFTATTAPALGALAGQPAAGTWRLRVQDLAAQDQGKLNSWRLLLKP